MKSLQIAAIHHIPWLEDRHTLSDGRVCIRLTTAANEFDAVTLRHAFHYAEGEPFAHATDIPMERMWRDENREVWQAVFAPRDPRIVYAFILRAGDVTLLHDADGTRAVPENPAWVSGFHYAHAYPAKEKPQWARGCVGYQIFPDRFRRVDVPGEEAVEPWGSKRVANEYRFGGNLKGILEAVPYLAELGVGVVYMTPIFLSDTSHRYNTFDYYQIDPLLGSLEDLRNLADALHARNIRIVLDGVFNHCGLGFAPFRDAMEKGKASEYYDWFFFGAQYPCGYMTFGEKWAYMPKLNLQNEDCAQYFLSVGRYWLEKCHVDGWRLDVSPEVWPDFWRQFKTMMRKVNPDSLMVAECWDDSREWLTVGDMFDSTMHYVLSRNIWSRFCRHEISTAQFDCALNRAAMLYPQRTQEVLWTFLGSHDTQRIRTRAGGDLRMVHAASFFQFTYLGSPIIYYGDELGMEGGEDPDCRRPMRWDDVEDNPTRAHYQKLARLRAQLPALRTGRFRSHVALENGLYAFRRETDTQQLLCVVNTGLQPVSVRLELPGGMAGMAAVHDHYSGRSLAVADGGVHISLKVGEGLILE